LQVNVPINEKKNYFFNYKESTTCQFTNGNNVNGSKVVAHIITRSLIILGLYAMKEKKDA
jgi:hypothetical protein